MICPACRQDNPPDVAFCGHCGRPLPGTKDKARRTETFQTVNASQELSTGSAFAGRYQVIEELGKGGMGRVYKVFDEKIKEKVALKLLKPEISADEAAIERFSNELRFARKIAHRHVCRMFDLGETGGSHYITMEYVSGEDLRSILRMTGPMSAGKTAYIARQVCEGLAEAHRLGVVHRDLKPQNIMIDREGNARIMDFGIARSLKVKGQTGAGVVIGTPEYMSPEQVEGREADGRSDIYSLGIILYEMTTGRAPFEGETFLSIALKQKTERPKAPREWNAHIPDDLNRLILLCLEKDKDRRYQKVEDVLADLDRIEKGVPATEKVLPAKKTTTSREFTVKITPKKLILPAAALAALAAAAALLFLFLPGKKASAPAGGKPFLAVLYFENNTGDPKLDHWRKALSELLITDLSQSKYITVLSGDRLFDVLSDLGQLQASSFSAGVLEDIARKSGADTCLRGGFTKAGESFRVNYMLQRVGAAAPLGSGWVGGEGEASFYPMVDELTRKVKSDLKLTEDEIVSDLDEGVGSITTASPEAFRYYTEGREYHNRSDYFRSIERMRRAVAVDPGFAMAYRSMAAAYSNMHLYSQAKTWHRKAHELSDRVSEKERLLIRADYYDSVENAPEKAVEALSDLLKIYPDDSFASTKMAFIYQGHGMYDLAVAHSQVAVGNKDRSYFAYSYQASCYLALGLPEKAREVLEGYFRDIGESGSLRLDLAEYFINQGKFERALEETDKAIALSPAYALNSMSRGDIYLYQGDPASAGREYEKLREKYEYYYLYKMFYLNMLRGKFKEAGRLAARGIELGKRIGEIWIESGFRSLLAYSEWKSGEREEALREGDRIWALAVQDEDTGMKREVLNDRGMICLELNDVAQARKAAEELKPLVDKSFNKNLVRIHHKLTGAVETHRGNTAKAVELLRMAANLLPYQHSQSSDVHAEYLEPLALAYEKAGDWEKAREEHERIVSLTTGRVRYPDIYARSFYRLGKIYERLGNKDRAAENYRKFLDLWKDADPGLPEVPDARKRLAAL